MQITLVLNYKIIEINILRYDVKISVHSVDFVILSMFMFARNSVYTHT